MTDSTAAPRHRCQQWEDRLTGPMFFLSLAFLVVLAGLCHRFPRLDPGDLEVYLILGGLAVLWLLFVIEALVRFTLRDRAQPVWRPLGVALVCALLPPTRMSCRNHYRPNELWLPFLGWRSIDTHLRTALERFFSVPMILLAFMVLPLFVLEYYWADQVREYPALALGLDIGTSFIWFAFSVELILMLAVAEHPLSYCLRHWIDVAVVLLPVVEVMPLFRMLRLGRVLRLDQLLRLGRLYRLQALAMRGWRAILLLQIVARLTRRSPAHRLKQLRELLQAKEEELGELREEIREMEEQIAQQSTEGHALHPLP